MDLSIKAEVAEFAARVRKGRKRASPWDIVAECFYGHSCVCYAANDVQRRALARELRKRGYKYPGRSRRLFILSSEKK